VLLLASFLAARAAPELALGLHADTLTHPGLLARGAWPLGRVGALEAQALAWWHPGHMTATQLRAGPALRWTGPRGGTWGAFVHLGACRGWWTSPTWEAEGEEVQRVRLAGDSWATATAGLELGHTTQAAGLAGWALRPQLGVRYPTFYGMGVDVALELAVRWGGAR
jgi:hypothetical protein